MHQILSRFTSIVCLMFLFAIPMTKAGAQLAETAPDPSESPDIGDAEEPSDPDPESPFPRMHGDVPDTGLVLTSDWPRIWPGGQPVVFSAAKEVLAPSMMLLTDGNELTDPRNCGVGRSPCLLVFGDLDSEFYAIKQRTFARHAQGPLPGKDFGDRGVNNMLAANFLSQRVLDRPYVLQLGETGVDYWIIPKCDSYVRFRKRIPAKQYRGQAEPVQLKC